MKGYIAFCPHFHQPHFQLYKTREEAFFYSYQAWLELLQEAVKLDDFFINLHFSGPFLYWFRDQKKEFTSDLRSLLDSKKIGILGGFADEPFIQLSSRSDDYLYQLKQYDELCTQLTGVSARDWQGIHLVERECGELLLAETTRAAQLIGAPPLYYLDAETFYQSHYALPGGTADYCLKHFGFKDPFSLTTISHIPQEMLYFGLRDEINGQVFYSVPVHSQYRYQLLKRNSFTAEDRIRVKPSHYLFYIKDALEQAVRLSVQYGRELEPIMLIFEDAEKMGQWSKDPQGDKQWLMEFFKLVEQDEELQFTGLRNYMDKVGFLDSYPVASSHSYPEWENWTAKRGIRGVCFGDERLRRVISRLRILEAEQEKFEKIILATIRPSQFADDRQDIWERAMLQSMERFEIIKQVLEQGYPPELAEYYALINRVRNLVYQEDPKWASRHPCYGSSPYYDMQGLAYLELAERLLIYLSRQISAREMKTSTLQLKDWDFDGRDEIYIQNERQSLAIDLDGGCIHYHHILAENLAGDYEQMGAILKNDFADIKAYHSIYRYAYPLVMTETDSSLKYEIFPDGARKENCRNSLRCELMRYADGEYIALEGLERTLYTVQEIVEEPNLSRVLLACEKLISSEQVSCKVRISKEFMIYPDKLSVTMKICIDDRNLDNLFLVPQIVSSAAASDEVDFCPSAMLGFKQGEGNTEILVHDIVENGLEGLDFSDQKLTKANPEEIDYLYFIHTGEGNVFANRICYNLKGNEIPKMEIRPAVQNYYQDLVFSGQSRLGYQSSGVMILPFIPLRDGQAKFSADISWELDSRSNVNDYQHSVQLIRG